MWGNQVVRIDAVTGRQTLVTSGDKLLWPEGVAVDPSGALYFAEGLLGSEPLAPNGVSEGFGGSVVRYDPVLGQQTLVSTGQYFWTIGPPNAIVRAADGQLLASLPAAIEPITSGALVSIDPATGAQTLVAEGSNFIGAERLAIDASGAIFVTSAYGAEGLPVIVRVDPATHEQTVVMSGYLLGTSPEQGNASPPQGIAVADDGSLVVVGAGSQSPVVRVDPSTGQQTLISPGGMTSLLMIPEDLALYPNLPGRTIVAAGGHEWSAAAWDDGSGTPTSPAAGDRAVVENFADVTVLLDHSGDPHVDSLSLYEAAVDVAPAAKLVVEGRVAIVGGSWLNVDGELVADEVVDGLRRPQYEPNVLSGSGTITARRVVIGGVLSPGGIGLGGAQTVFVGSGAAAADGGAATVPEPGSLLLLLSSFVPFAVLLFGSPCRRVGRAHAGEPTC